MRRTKKVKPATNPSTLKIRQVLEMQSKTLELMTHPESPPRITEFTTNRFTTKMWVDPENRLIALHSWHYEFFRDNPQVAQKYGVVFADENSTRLAALRVGFIRFNYELNGGF